MWIFRGEKPTQEALTPVGMELEQRPLGVNYNTNTFFLGPLMFVEHLHFLQLFTRVL